MSDVWSENFSRLANGLSREVWQYFSRLLEEERNLRERLSLSSGEEKGEILRKLREVERRRSAVLVRVMRNWGVVPLQLDSLRAGIRNTSPSLEMVLLVKELDSLYHKAVRMVSEALLRSDIPPEEAGEIQAQLAGAVRKAKEALESAVEEVRGLEERLSRSASGACSNV